jgi:hypothetical protein
VSFWSIFFRVFFFFKCLFWSIFLNLNRFKSVEPHHQKNTPKSPNKIKFPKNFSCFVFHFPPHFFCEGSNKLVSTWFEFIIQQPHLC